MIRPAARDDSDALARIYNHYVAHTIVTFEEAPVTPGDMALRLQDVLDAQLPYLVSTNDDDEITGYAYATKWRTRSGYRFSTEITVYLDPVCVGRGLGSQLYGTLFPLLVERGVHAVMGGIALPNDGSIALHEKFGLRKVAHFQEVGFKFGRWIDVGYWQRLL